MKDRHHDDAMAELYRDDPKLAAEVLSAHGAVAPAIVHDRVDYAASMVDGRTVQETDPKGRSAEEINQLLAFVQERINAKKKTIKKETV